MEFDPKSLPSYTYITVYRKDSKQASQEGSERREHGKGPPEEGLSTLFNPSVITFSIALHPQALQQGNNDGARIYASNAIRKKSESLNLLRLSSRIDAVASRVETAVTMRAVTGSITSVVRGMDKAMESMNLERVRILCRVQSLVIDFSSDLSRYGQIRVPIF